MNIDASYPGPYFPYINTNTNIASQINQRNNTLLESDRNSHPKASRINQSESDRNSQS